MGSTRLKPAAQLLYARAQFTVGASNWAGVTAGREMTPEDNSRAAKVVLLGSTMVAQAAAAERARREAIHDALKAKVSDL